MVSFGTSSPELFVSLKAALAGQGDLAIGNVIGSNSFNIGVILGLTALICPVTVKLQILRIDAPVMISAVVLISWLISTGSVGRMAGGVLLAMLAAYTVLNVMLAKKERSAEIGKEYEEGVPHRSPNPLVDVVFILGGLALLVIGSRLLVDNCVIVARAWGISEAVIGLTILAAGTSMPELATSVIAALRKEPDIAIGNAVGSNTFNCLGILGATAVLQPLTVSGIRPLDLGVMIGLSVLLVPLLWSGLKLLRFEGAILLLCYAGYLAMLWPKG
ncbi:MAG: calcium/sodium antiporter [Terrimicrobiaceae bacterium]